MLFNLHRKQLPLHVLKERAKSYVDLGLIQQDMAERIIRVIEWERGDSFYVNDVQPGDAQEAGGGGSSLSTRLSPEQMRALLERRVEMMKQGGDGLDAGVTDQYRVYSYIVSALEQGLPLRLMVQASAGTGKSFLLTTVYLWCLVHEKRTKATDSSKIVPESELLLGGEGGMRAAASGPLGSLPEAAAPTGIAAANIEIEKTGVAATTIHNLFEVLCFCLRLTSAPTALCQPCTPQGVCPQAARLFARKCYMEETLDNTRLSVRWRV